MKYLQYILTGLIVLILAGCSDNESSIISIGDDNSNSKIVGDKVILSSSLIVEGFRDVNVTRSFTDQPSLDNLKLYIIEFVDNEDPLTNTLSAVYRPSQETPEGDLVKYTVTLNKTDQPRILHLLAVADDDLNIPYGVESSVMPGLIAGNNKGDQVDAYWRRIEFKNGYCTQQTVTNDGITKQEWVINADLEEKLIGKNIKLVRNFAKMTVGSVAADFILEGFQLINTPQQGTMVPYSASNKLFPEFLGSDDKPLPYSTVAEKYSGISPAGTLLDNEVTSEDGPEIPTNETTDVNGTLCLPAQYMYERPFSSISRTFVIIKGRYKNGNSSYYKLDIGKNDNNGIFRYYGILRNFNYFIRINRVQTDGYETPSAAAEGTVYNNISFDVDTDELKNMSDGSDIVRVNTTTAVITEDNYSFDFQYAYKTDIRTNGRYDYTKATLIDFVPGAVIKKIEPTGIISDADNAQWYTAKIYCENPTEITQTQSFVVVNTQTGLGRTINLVSHKKWEFGNLCEYAGIWENHPETYNGEFIKNSNGSKGEEISGLKNATYYGIAGTDAASQFTIFFDIPDNIPEVLFPLEFTIESNLQGLENEPMGTIVVSPGPSLFPENNGYNRIQYIKSVTWSEYNAPLRMDVRDDNGTVIGNAGDGPVTHRVRCRFRTIENVANGTEVTVAIANENFASDSQTSWIKFSRTDDANKLEGQGLIWVAP